MHYGSVALTTVSHRLPVGVCRLRTRQPVRFKWKTWFRNREDPQSADSLLLQLQNRKKREKIKIKNKNKIKTKDKNQLLRVWESCVVRAWVSTPLGFPTSKLWKPKRGLPQDRRFTREKRGGRLLLFSFFWAFLTNHRSNRCGRKIDQGPHGPSKSRI